MTYLLVHFMNARVAMVTIRIKETSGDTLLLYYTNVRKMSRVWSETSRLVERSLCMREG